VKDFGRKVKGFWKPQRTRVEIFGSLLKDFEARSVSDFAGAVSDRAVPRYPIASN